MVCNGYFHAISARRYCIFVGKECASQALSRIGISINPEIAFPGQRSWEVVRPILNMLKEEKTALQNFEALMALTNLAQMSDSVRYDCCTFRCNLPIISRIISIIVGRE